MKKPPLKREIKSNIAMLTDLGRAYVERLKKMGYVAGQRGRVTPKSEKIRTHIIGDIPRVTRVTDLSNIPSVTRVTRLGDVPKETRTTIIE